MYIAISSILLILSRHAYTLRHAIDLHVHESCMRVAVRVRICIPGAFILAIYTEKIW